MKLKVAVVMALAFSLTCTLLPTREAQARCSTVSIPCMPFEGVPAQYPHSGIVIVRIVAAPIILEHDAYVAICVVFQNTTPSPIADARFSVAGFDADGQVVGNVLSIDDFQHVPSGKIEGVNAWQHPLGPSCIKSNIGMDAKSRIYGPPAWNLKTPIALLTVRPTEVKYADGSVRGNTVALTDVEHAPATISTPTPQPEIADIGVQVYNGVFTGTALFAGICASMVPFAVTVVNGSAEDKVRDLSGYVDADGGFNASVFTLQGELRATGRIQGDTLIAAYYDTNCNGIRKLTLTRSK